MEFFFYLAKGRLFWLMYAKNKMTFFILKFTNISCDKTGFSSWQYVGCYSYTCLASSPSTCSEIRRWTSWSIASHLLNNTFRHVLQGVYISSWNDKILTSTTRNLNFSGMRALCKSVPDQRIHIILPDTNLFCSDPALDSELWWVDLHLKWS